jgi:hypothetical protein
MTMTDTEAKALALVNEYRRAAGYRLAERIASTDQDDWYCAAKLAIEREEATEARHAAELREQAERFSEAVRYCIGQGMAGHHRETLEQFILTAPDPLVEVLKEADAPSLGDDGYEAMADRVHAAEAALAVMPPVPAGLVATRWQLGDKVRKKRGSSWRGTVCGFYSTPHTPQGYCVDSAFEPGSVQVWPEAALEDWDGGSDAE